MTSTKRVLIISPYFPPSNAADMQRIRMSLPYFKDFGWDAEVACVDEKYSDMVKDELLVESVPAEIMIYKVKALSKNLTSKLGLGSIALRSLWYYKAYVNRLLKSRTFDLIYFSTTQFPVAILGPYWKRKYNVPYIIDMQDPWLTEYYANKPKEERPPKYWFSYRLNKLLERIAMKDVSGIISVSKNYIETLRYRYPWIKNIPASTITFGAFERDLELVRKKNIQPVLTKRKGNYELVYVGRGGQDMHPALEMLFKAFYTGLQNDTDLFSKFRFHFIGTSYAPEGKGKHTIMPLAIKHGLSNFVNEQTNRVPFYAGIATLLESDGLVLLGSDDPGYTASKIYPYILSKKPLIGFFHEQSSALGIINQCNAGKTVALHSETDIVYLALKEFLDSVITKTIPNTKWDAFYPYTAKEMTRNQVELFEKVTQ